MILPYVEVPIVIVDNRQIFIDSRYRFRMQEIMLARIKRNFHGRFTQLSNKATEIAGRIDKIFTINRACRNNQHVWDTSQSKPVHNSI